MTPLHPTRATADTELLGDPHCRRFIMVLWEMNGGTLTVTPGVADELPGNVRQSEGRHWRSVLRYDAQHSNRRYDEPTYRSIIEATKDAAERWIKEELRGTGAGGLTSATPTMAADELADQIEATMPLKCFRRPDNPNQRTDRRIIAEACAFGYTLLATENLGTIKLEVTNAWLEQEGHVRDPLIVPIHQAASALTAATGKELGALTAALGAALPDRDLGIERDLRIIHTYLARLQNTHARTCATWALDAMEDRNTRGELIQRVRDALPARSRATEARRVVQTRNAACEAGYLGG